MRGDSLALLEDLASGGPGVPEEITETADALLHDGLDEDALERAPSLLRLAELLQADDRPEDAEPFATWALRIFVMHHGERDPRVARALRGVADIARQGGDLERARTLLEKAKQILVDTGPPRALARTLNDLALVLREAGRLTEAEAVLRRALEKTAGPDAGVPAAEAATAWSNYGGLLSELGRTDEATQAYVEALEHLDAVEDPEELEPERRAQVLNNLGAHLEGSGRGEQARPFLEEALALRREALPEGHPHLASTLMNLAILEQELGEVETALRHAREAYAIAQLVFGPAHAACARYREAFVDLLEAVGRADEAERVRSAARYAIQ